jgi:hypothetical protein
MKVGTRRFEKKNIHEFGGFIFIDERILSLLRSFITPFVIVILLYFCHA